MRHFSLLLLLTLLLAACLPQEFDPGRVLIAPEGEIVAGSPVAWTVTYTLGDALESGAQVRLLFPHPYHNNRPPNLLPQIENPQAPGFCALRVNGEAAPLHQADTALYPKHLIADVPGKGWPKQSELVFSCPQFIAPHAADELFAPFVVVDVKGDGNLIKPPQDNAASIVAGPAVRAKLTAPSTVRRGKSYTATVTFLDEFGNATDKVNAPALKQIDDKHLAPGEGSLAVNEGFARLTDLDAPREIQVFYLEADFGGALPPVKSNPIRLVGKNDPLLLFGDIHGHSTISDGAREPEAWYATARGPAALDFAALTDHEWQVDPAEWATIKQLCREQNGPEFIALLGWEYSLGGHGIVYYPNCAGEPEISVGGARELWDLALGNGRALSWQRFGGAFRPDQGYKPAVWEHVKRSGALYIGHTTATQDMGDEADLDDPDAVRAIEIYSGHGSDFSADTADRVPNFAPRGTVLAMLARGRRFGLVATSDTHDSRPGLATWGHAPGGLTAVSVARRDRADIYEAIREGHTYATTGNRSLVRFTVDGHGPGERFATDAPIKVEWDIYGDGKLKQVQIWRNGAAWISQPTEDMSMVRGTATHAGGGAAWYLLRLELADGGRVWTSPIYVDDPRRLVVQRFVALDAGGESEVVIEATPGVQTEAVKLWRRHGDDGGPDHEAYEQLAELTLSAGPVHFRDPDPGAPGLTTYYLLEERTADGVVRYGPIALNRFPESESFEGGFRFPAYLQGSYAAQVLIRDLDGRIIRRIPLPEKRGLITVTWDGRDEQGRPIKQLTHYRIEQGPYHTSWKPLIPPGGPGAR